MRRWLARDGWLHRGGRLAAVVLLTFGVPGLAAAEVKDVAPYVKGEFIVKFKSNGPQALTRSAHHLLKKGRLKKGRLFAKALADSSDSIDRLNEWAEVTGAREVFPRPDEEMRIEDAQAAQSQRDGEIRAAFAARTRRAPGNVQMPDLTNIYVFKVREAPGEKKDIEAICARYADDPHVVYAHPHYLLAPHRVAHVPNDTHWSRKNSWRQPYDDLWGLKKLQVEQAWDLSQGQGIVVAVLDTGVDYEHPDLQANIWTDPILGTHGWDFGNNDGDPMDQAGERTGHGTHVAGIIAAVGDNDDDFGKAKGLIGVAPKAKIMPVKIYTDQGQFTQAAAAAGISYAVDKGADVLNNSWGCLRPCPTFDPDGDDKDLIKDTVAKALASGAVVVFSAGNSKQDVRGFSPQNLELRDPDSQRFITKPIVVAAVTETDVPWWGKKKEKGEGTNFGTLVDVAAPGAGNTPQPRVSDPVRNILSLKARTYPQDGLVVGEAYVRKRGTSMAAPHAAGVAALILAYCDGLADLTNANEIVRQVLRGSADPVHAQKQKPIGAGRLNAARALDLVDFLRDLGFLDGLGDEARLADLVDHLGDLVDFLDEKDLWGRLGALAGFLKDVGLAGQLGYLGVGDDGEFLHDLRYLVVDLLDKKEEQCDTWDRLDDLARILNENKAFWKDLGGAAFFLITHGGWWGCGDEQQGT